MLSGNFCSERTFFSKRHLTDLLTDNQCNYSNVLLNYKCIWYISHAHMHVWVIKDSKTPHLINLGVFEFLITHTFVCAIHCERLFRVFNYYILACFALWLSNGNNLCPQRVSSPSWHVHRPLGFVGHWSWYAIACMHRRAWTARMDSHLTQWVWRLHKHVVLSCLGFEDEIRPTRTCGVSLVIHRSWFVCSCTHRCRWCWRWRECEGMWHGGCVN